MTDSKIKTISDHASRPVKVQAETYVQVGLVAAAGALLEHIGEHAVGWFPKFWANGDGLQVTFRRVPKE